MNSLQKGYRRDRELLALVESCGVLNTEQIKLLLFPNVSERVARRRLQTLTEKGYLKRNRLSISQPFFYYSGQNKKPGQMEHLLAVNWVYTWLSLKLNQWERLHSFQRELDYKILRPDGLVAIENIVQKSFDFSFVELHRQESGNKFDKPEKYTALYLSEGYMDTWWAKLAYRFPSILVVTTGRKQPMQEQISANNPEGLRFKVYTLDEIKGECFNGRSR